jgi:hypothetical protein
MPILATKPVSLRPAIEVTSNATNKGMTVIRMALIQINPSGSVRRRTPFNTEDPE